MATTTKNAPGSKDSISDKLITKEDPFHIHKSLGVACLLSYAIRFSQYVLYGDESDCFFASHPQYTLPTFALHFLLNVTSFEFDIPKRRISTGYRIWPEYRWHSAIFLTYTLLVMTTFWVEQHYHLPRLHVLNYIITMLIMAAADTASWSVDKKYQSNTIRDLEAPQAIKFVFAFAQFVAKVTLLYTPARRYATFFFFALIIQVNAFMMTLRRKNVFEHTTLVGMYFVLLLIGLAIIVAELFRFGGGWMTFHVVTAMACASFFLRTGPMLPEWIHNKYLVWTLMALLLNGCFLPRYHKAQDDNEIMEALHRQVKHSSLASGALLLIYGYYRCSRGTTDASCDSNQSPLKQKQG
jgi:hypothetical protein